MPAPFFLSGQRPAFGARPGSARDFPASCRSQQGGASTRCRGVCPPGGESSSIRKAAPAPASLRWGRGARGWAEAVPRPSQRPVVLSPGSCWRSLQTQACPCRVQLGSCNSRSSSAPNQPPREATEPPFALTEPVLGDGAGAGGVGVLGAERSPRESTSWAKGRCALLSRASKPARSPRSWAPGCLELLAGRSPAASALGRRTPLLSPCF